MLVKKVLASLLAGICSISIGMNTIVSAASIPSPITIVEDDMMQNLSESANSQIVTVSEIDDLYEKRLEATVNHDLETYDQITQTLRNYGVEKLSYNEVMELTNDSTDDSEASFLADNGITYESYNTTYRYDGETYEILRILATPDPRYGKDTMLYTTGVTTCHNVDPQKATLMPLIEVGVDSLLGLSNKANIAKTVYDVFRGIADGLSSTSTITDIEAVYVWNVAEACSFVHVRKQSNASFALRGVYHKASAGVGINLPVLYVNGNDISASIDQANISVNATPVNYNSTAKAVESFVEGGKYRSSVTDVELLGVQDESIEHIYLSNPETPSEAGYR